MQSKWVLAVAVVLALPFNALAEDRDKAREEYRTFTDNAEFHQKQPALTNLISLYWTLNTGCRGSSGDKPETWRFCKAREQLSYALTGFGLCMEREIDGNIITDKWEVCPPVDDEKPTFNLTYDQTPPGPTGKP